MREPETATSGREALAAGAAGGPPPLVLLNPASARGRTLRRLLERALRGGRGELVIPDCAAATQHAAREAALAGRGIVAVGGDGTIAQIANGILGAAARVPLGIVPAGNGNDYALRAIRLPADPLRALEIALEGAPRPVDAGIVNGRYFVNCVGVGIDANIAAAAERLKRVPLLRGKRLYWTAALSELLLRYARCPELLVTCDGQTDQRQLYALAAISIGPTYGGGFHVNPAADPADGLFDVCAITKPPLPRALRLLPLVERGQHVGQPEVRQLRAREVVLEARQAIAAHLDGEVIAGERFAARVLPGALLVRHPPVAGSA